VYHVLNRGVGRRTLFEKDGDFLTFEKVVEETLRTCRMRLEDLSGTVLLLLGLFQDPFEGRIVVRLLEDPYAPNRKQ